MENSVIDKVYRISEDRSAEVSLDFKRYLYEDVDWNSRLICIKGPRGVGKTTMMLQHMKETLGAEEGLYVSLDNIWVDAREIYPKFVSWALGRRGFRRMTTPSRPASTWKPVFD